MKNYKIVIVIAIFIFVQLSSELSLSDKSKFFKSSKLQTLAQNVNLTVETPLGAIQGHVLQTREGRDYYAFYKVPYAQPPVGDLRFKSPLPTTKWEGIRNETKVATECIQKEKYNPIDWAIGKEDCLYMNIYTPKLPSANGSDGLLPTLFYIHGGGFTDGNGSRYSGKYILDEDVVLITFQYRLGAFGFLSTEDGEITGNMAFKDQIMALRFVKQNIQYFGGNPDNVMIFGNSAGGLSVSHLMISPMANGLFHSAITQSGGSFCMPVVDSASAKKTLDTVAEAVNCNSGNQSSVIQCLRAVDAFDIAVVVSGNINYNLRVENYTTDDLTDVFMPDTPHNIVESGRGNRVPWIIGVNSQEFVHVALGYLLDTNMIATLNSNFTIRANELLGLNLASNAAEVISSNLNAFYFEGKPVSNDTQRNLTNLVSDRGFLYCSKVQGMMQSEFSDVYFYYLSKQPEKSYADPVTGFYPPGDYGVAHADELQFLFLYNGYPEYPTNSSYYPFSRELIKMWTKFASTGNPSPDGQNWEPVKPGQNPISYFELNDEMKPTTVLQERMEFWDQFTHGDLNLNSIIDTDNYNLFKNSPFNKINKYC